MEPVHWSAADCVALMACSSHWGAGACEGPELNAIIEINPNAVAIAEELDRRFQASGVTGPLHGIPVVLKANIDTSDAMATSAGSLALVDHHASVDAFHVQKLRDAGAVILAKTNLSEWANFRDQASSSGWSSIGGQTKNPHVLEVGPLTQVGFRQNDRASVAQLGENQPE